MLLGEYKAMSCLGESTVLWARQGLVPQGDLGFVQVVRNSPFPQHFVRLVSASWSRNPSFFFSISILPIVFAFNSCFVVDLQTKSHIIRLVRIFNIPCYHTQLAGKTIAPVWQSSRKMEVNAMKYSLFIWDTKTKPTI